MTRARPLFALGCAMAALCLLAPIAAGAASFDCQRARSKLNRTICSDLALSRLDETVWNAYGERIRTLSALQYAHVRERHLLWRRSRGLYETTVEALTHEYASHLEWLRHPLLGLEGRYQRSGLGGTAAHLEVEVDVRSPAAADLRGMTTVPRTLVWQAALVQPEASAPTATPVQQGRGVSLRVRPQLLGDTLQPGDTCEFELAFTGDEVRLSGNADCSPTFNGSYTRTPRD